MNSQKAFLHNPVLIELLSRFHLHKLLEHFIPLTFVVNNLFVSFIEAFLQSLSRLNVLPVEFIQSDSSIIIVVNHIEYLLDNQRVKLALLALYR